MDWEGRVTLIETHRMPAGRGCLWAQGRPVSPPPEPKPGRHYLSHRGEAQGRSMWVPCLCQHAEQQNGRHRPVVVLEVVTQRRPQGGLYGVCCAYRTT